LRHRFAIRTLLGWHRQGLDVEQQLPVLSTYLGHACVRDTYWYLSACPELMGEAVRRVDRRLGGRAMKPNGSVATLIERYFTERLMRQRNVSAQHDRILQGHLPSVVHVCPGATS
jgi:hypothetical protein